jgi:hypothetical protein
VDVDLMLESISSQQINEWMAFYQLEPFGADAQNIGHAITASTVANVNRQKGQKAFKVSDFMPNTQHAEKQQTVDEMINLAAIFTASLGGQDLRPDPEDE